MSMSSLEVDNESLRLEELQLKLKIRMLGAIRFIGELYKCNLIMSGAIQECFDTLLLPDSTKGCDLPGESELEALCRLIRTVGESFEKKDFSSMDKVIGTLTLLSQDRRLNSRIRYGIEEILALRLNQWVERRLQEGPLKIDEISNKVAEEYRKNNTINNNQRIRSHSGSFQGTPSRTVSNSFNNNNRVLGRPRANSNRLSDNESDSTGYSGNGGSRGPSRSRSDSMGPYYTALSFMPVPDSGKLMQSVVEDFLSNENLVEVKDILKDAPADAIGWFVLKIFGKYVDSTNVKLKEKLIRLIGDVRDILVTNRSEIIPKFRDYEPFKFLADTILDNKMVRYFI